MQAAKAVLDRADAEFIATVEAGRASLHEAAETARRERGPVQPIVQRSRDGPNPTGRVSRPAKKTRSPPRSHSRRRRN